MYFHYLPVQISIVLCAFVSLCWVPGWCNWLLSKSRFAPGSWSWTHHRHHVVQLFLYIVHHSHKKIWSFAVVPICVIRWYPSWVLRCGVWDWGGMTMRGKVYRIVCLWCECRCLRRMKGLSRGWGWAGCIRDRMDWWGIRVQLYYYHLIMPLFWKETYRLIHTFFYYSTRIYGKYKTFLMKVSEKL